MGSAKQWFHRLSGFLRSEDYRGAVLNILRHRYVREKQHAMRYGQHAERMHYPQFHDALRSLAAEEENHAELIAAKIKDLGGKLPEVIPIHVAHEPNSWYYLRTDLEEEQRCAGELGADLPILRNEYPDIAELLDRIESEGKRHRAKIRDMLARSDPQAADRA